MFELLKCELRKIYRNKIIWIMLFVFFGMIIKDMPYHYNMNKFAADINVSREFLTGDYNKDNYKDLYKQYEYYMDRIEHHSYKSTKICDVNESHVNYAPISDKLNPSRDNCERLEDAIKADQSLVLFFKLENYLAFDEKDEETGTSSFDYFVELANSDSTQFAAISSESAHKIAEKLNDQYKNHTFHFENFNMSALLAFTNFMRDRTIHYIVFMIIIGLASIFAKEHQSRVKELTLTMKSGRSKLINAKLCASLIYGISVFTVLSLFTFIAHAVIYDLSIQNVSFQFFSSYNYSPYLFNLFQYTLIYIRILLILILAVTLVVSLMSSLCRHNYTAFLLSLSFLYIPLIFHSSQMYMKATQYSLMNTADTDLLFAAQSGIELGPIFIPSLPFIIIIYILVILTTVFMICYKEKKTPHS